MGGRREKRQEIFPASFACKINNSIYSISIKLTALPGARNNQKHTDSMPKKKISKTDSAPAVDRAAPCSALRARCYVAASGSVLIPWTCAVRRKDAIAKAQNATCKPWSHLRTVGWSMKAAILIEVG